MAYTIQFTAAKSGSGKSYRRGPHMIVNEWIPNNKGIHYSNFPLKVDKIAAECVRRHNSLSWFRKILLRDHSILTVEAVTNRIQLIPADVLHEWKERKSGPWDYFKDKNLVGAHIAIDECHVYIATEDDAEWVKSWKDWLGGLRHHKVQAIEFLSQAEMKVSKKIRDEAHVRRTLFNGEIRQDPFFHILMGDWYEMRAKFISGEYTSKVWEEEYITHDKKSELQKCVKFDFQQLYYDMYDSYNMVFITAEDHQQSEDKKEKESKPGEEKTSSAYVTTAGAVEHIFQQRSKLGLIFWFIRRNGFNIFSKITVFILGVWLCFFGGINTCLQGFSKYLQVVTTANAHKKQVNASSTATILTNSTNQTNNGAVSPSQIPVNSPQIIDLQDQIKSLKEKLTAEELELDRLKDAEEKAHEFVMIDSNGVILRDGTSLSTGDTIEGGPWDGLSIKSVDIQKRHIELSNGRVVRLSSH